MRTRETLNLRTLPVSSQFELETRSKDGRGVITYEVEIIEAGEHPTCTITEKDAEGKVTSSGVGILEGTGIWTTPDQNPTQVGDPLWGKPHKELALSIGHGQVGVGGFICIVDPTSRERYMINFPCSQITIRGDQET